MTIRAGRLQARLSVTAQQLVDLPNGGQDVVDVAVLVNTPADVVPIGSDETLAAGHAVRDARRIARICGCRSMWPAR